MNAVRELSLCELSTNTTDLFRSLKRPLTDCETTHLFATNYEVDIFNAKELQSMSGTEAIYEAEDKNITKAFEKTCPVPRNLKLKPKAKVMLCHTFNKKFCNGMLGEVQE